MTLTKTQHAALQAAATKGLVRSGRGGWHMAVLSWTPEHSDKDVQALVELGLLEMMTLDNRGRQKAWPTPEGQRLVNGVRP